MRLSRPATLVALSVLLAPCAFVQPVKAQVTPQERMKACNVEAGQQDLSGDKRKSFMAECLAGKPAASATSPAAPAPANPGATTTAPSQAGLLDINAASKDQQLEALPQIGPARAEAIIKGRPYKAKNELVERYIVPQKAYKAIQNKIVAWPRS